MNLTIKLPDEDVQALKAKATARGVSAEQYALQVLEKDLAPEWLRESWASAKDAGLDRLSMDEIDAEIAAARKSRREGQAAPRLMIRVVLDTTSSSRRCYSRSDHRRRCSSGYRRIDRNFASVGKCTPNTRKLYRRPRFHREESIITAPLDAIREKGLWVRPAEAIRACADPDDDIFLECAQAARAAYLVTGNIKDFPAFWHDTEIVTARRFLEVMSGETEQNEKETS